MPRSITTFLMFDGIAEQAIDFYRSLFKGAQVRIMERWGADEPRRAGAVKSARLSLSGEDIVVLDYLKNDFIFTPAKSLFVECESAAELDDLYEALSAGGQIVLPRADYGFSKLFGSVTDRFGLSWQLSWS